VSTMRHTLGKIYAKSLDDSNFVFNCLLSAAHRARLSVIQSHCHSFYPQGCTAVLILAESHITVHTYPEHCLCYVDAFTCGDVHPSVAIDLFKLLLGATGAELVTVDRDALKGAIGADE
jgi:S-adenosylmethionine decarboxylase